jgi:hypothetical protein
MSWNWKNLLAALAATIAAASPAAAGQFTVGNIVVALSGDGQSITGSANSASVVPVQLLEYTTAGSLVQSIPLPTADSGNQHILTLNRDRASGQLNLTADNRHLVIGGIDVAPRTTVTSPVPRTVGRISYDGSIDTSTRIADSYDGPAESGIRGVASFDGSGFWLAGKGLNGTDKRGIQYIELGSSTPTYLTNQQENSRHLSIVNGQLYNTDKQVDAVGTGLPTSGPVIPAPFIPNAAGGGDWNSAQLFDLDPTVPGIDTLYFAYASHETGNDIEKWTSNGTTWSQSEVFNILLPSGVEPADGVLFLTARQLGSDVELFATTRAQFTNAAANSLVRILDTAAGSTTTLLATAAASYTFKGVSFAPVPEPATALLLLVSLAGAAAFRRR